MRPVTDLMWKALVATGEALRGWLEGLSLDPGAWSGFTWLIIAGAALLLLALLLRPRRAAAGRRPELLISHGEVVLADGRDRDLVASALSAPAHAPFELRMTVSNLGTVPVQLLELSVRTNGGSAPNTAEVGALVPPHGAVDVTVEVHEMAGDEGRIDLYLYAPDMRPKTFRLRARLRWEPWNARFKLLPLAQRVDKARILASSAQNRRDARTWRQRVTDGAPELDQGSLVADRARGPVAPLPKEPTWEAAPHFVPSDETLRPRGAREPRPAANDRPRSAIVPGDGADVRDAVGDPARWGATERPRARFEPRDRAAAGPQRPRADAARGEPSFVDPLTSEPSPGARDRPAPSQPHRPPTGSQPYRAESRQDGLASWEEPAAEVRQEGAPLRVEPAAERPASRDARRSAPEVRPPEVRPPAERPSAERPPAERLPAERPSEQRLPAERPPAERPSAERPAVRQHRHERSTEGGSPTERPIAERSADRLPNRLVPEPWPTERPGIEPSRIDAPRGARAGSGSAAGRPRHLEDDDASAVGRVHDGPSEPRRARPEPIEPRHASPERLEPRHARPEPLEPGRTPNPSHPPRTSAPEGPRTTGAEQPWAEGATWELHRPERPASEGHTGAQVGPWWGEVNGSASDHAAGPAAALAGLGEMARRLLRGRLDPASPRASRPAPDPAALRAPDTAGSHAWRRPGAGDGWPIGRPSRTAPPSAAQAAPDVGSSASTDAAAKPAQGVGPAPAARGADQRGKAVPPDGAPARGLAGPEEPRVKLEFPDDFD